jgi:hypothetical protein
MHDDITFDDLERFLTTSPILGTAAFSHVTAHHSYRLTLSGGVAVMAKPADEIGDGEVLVGREAAAWAIARELGWGDLVAATVQRDIPSFRSGDPVTASLQVIWPDVRPDAPPELFGDEDVWRAAVFDVLVAHEDRGGHNWLLMPDSGAAEPTLKLIDHGYAFGQTFPPNSSFFQMREGAELPDFCLTALQRLASHRHSADLGRLLDAGALDGVMERGRGLVENGTLEL